jgi:putative ABC transport system permease protein
LLLGLVCGLLTALTFAIPPLARAQETSVAALFRDHAEAVKSRLRLKYLALAALALAALAAAILAFSPDRRLALIYLGAVLAGYVLLRGISFAVMALARALPHGRPFELRLALANIHRPGALTPSVVLSLGLGLALLVALTLIDGNIRAQLQQGRIGETPSFFFLNVPKSQTDGFLSFLREEVPEGKIESVPMLRGRIVRVKDQRAEEVKPKPDAAWALDGDRGITYSDKVPEGSELVAGTWWGESGGESPLVSMEADIADGLGLKIGDSITVNVLGRNVTARIASLRKVNWRSFGINFVMVFDPKTFARAPQSALVTLAFPKGGDPAREAALSRAAAAQFPGIAAVRLTETLNAVNDLVAQLALAIRGASGVALLASALVLAGALAASQTGRVYEAVILKTLGATRLRLMAAFSLEYALIGLVTAIFGVAAGTAAAYVIATSVMKMSFVMFWPQAVSAALGALVFTLVLGLVGTWRTLGQKPAPYLREL